MSELASDWIKVHDWHRMLCCDSAQGLLHTATCEVIQECQLRAGFFFFLVFFYFKILQKEKWNLKMCILFASEYYSVLFYISKICWSVSFHSIKVNIQCLHSEIRPESSYPPESSRICHLCCGSGFKCRVIVFHLKLK